jgi:hypothetical protein
MTTFYNKPTPTTKLMNGVFMRLASLGFTPRDTVAVQVRGRKSGRLRSNVVTWVEVDGARYLVAPRGTTEWVRNVRAAAGEAAIKHGRSEPVRLIEVPEGERAPIIHAYVQKQPGMVRREFGVKSDEPMSEYERIAPRHPVFRIEPR